MVSVVDLNHEHGMNVEYTLFTTKKGCKIYVLSGCVLRRAGLERICECETGFELIGFENTVPQNMDIFAAAHPDIIVVDQSLFSDSHAQDIDITLHSLHEFSHIIILADQLDLSFACSAIADGAEGYLLTSSSIDEILQALRVVASGGMWLEQSIVRTLAHQVMTTGSQSTENEHPFRVLSEREQQILYGFAQGHTSKEIASHLCLSESSVRTYWYRVLNKLNAINKVEAIVIAGQMGLLDALPLKHEYYATKSQ
ncbi:MAG TPA: response regulator transcription factor [Ktedonobacteraceae bacterium]|nr:response regulator transcription factor [Ktedonobacteraceae bacterium]